MSSQAVGVAVMSPVSEHGARQVSQRVHKGTEWRKINIKLSTRRQGTSTSPTLDVAQGKACDDRAVKFWRDMKKILLVRDEELSDLLSIVRCPLNTSFPCMSSGSLPLLNDY